MRLGLRTSGQGSGLVSMVAVRARVRGWCERPSQVRSRVEMSSARATTMVAVRARVRAGATVKGLHDWMEPTHAWRDAVIPP